ncbi:MAG: MarR family winged helix-turn-helix transcriptional regulator [Pseudoxanthomonas sp.]
MNRPMAAGFTPQEEQDGLAAIAEIPTPIESDSQVDQSRLQRFIGYRLTRASVQIHKLFVKRIGTLELKPVEFSILVLADANAGINLRQLGDALDISPPNLVQVIDRLSKRKLLKRVRSRQDRRIQHLHLTPEGSELLATAESEVADLENRIAEVFTATEKKTLMMGLGKLSRL